MMESDVDLLQHCVSFVHQHIEEAENKTYVELQTSGGTRLVAKLRIFRLQRCIQAIGMFQLFESLDQEERKGNLRSIGDPLQKLGYLELARDFDNLFLAVNVLSTSSLCPTFHKFFHVS